MIKRVYKEAVPALRFIGKKYGDSDRVEGNFGAKWGEWFQNGWFETLEKLYGGDLTQLHESGDAYIGLMRDDRGVFEYWIGIFLPTETPVPDGFGCVDFAAGELGVCWVYGKENEVYMREGECGEKMKAKGYDIDGGWCFERYACPRFTVPDEHGNIILDICFYLR